MQHDKMNTVEFFPLGDGAVLVEFGRGICPQTHQRVKAFADYLESHPFDGFLEYTAAFSSVTVFYDPFYIEAQTDDIFPSVCKTLETMLSSLQQLQAKEPDIVEIPVYYGDTAGPDLEYVASQHGLRPEEVIEIHTEGRYLVYMIGFAPGFPYLGGLSEKIATPRRSSPRLVIPAGSVGIAGQQTGVYPIETPGGWQLIGRTPLALFRPDQAAPTLLQAGNIIRFRSITRREYTELAKEAAVCKSK